MHDMFLGEIFGGREGHYQSWQVGKSVGKKTSARLRKTNFSRAANDVPGTFRHGYGKSAYAEPFYGSVSYLHGNGIKAAGEALENLAQGLKKAPSRAARVIYRAAEPTYSMPAAVAAIVIYYLRNR